MLQTNKQTRTHTPYLARHTDVDVATNSASPDDAILRMSPMAPPTAVDGSDSAGEPLSCSVGDAAGTAPAPTPPDGRALASTSSPTSPAPNGNALPSSSRAHTWPRTTPAARDADVVLGVVDASRAACAAGVALTSGAGRESFTAAWMACHWAGRGSVGHASGDSEKCRSNASLRDSRGGSGQHTTRAG